MMGLGLCLNKQNEGSRENGNPQFLHLYAQAHCLPRVCLLYFLLFGNVGRHVVRQYLHFQPLKTTACRCPYRGRGWSVPYRVQPHGKSCLRTTHRQFFQYFNRSIVTSNSPSCMAASWTHQSLKRSKLKTTICASKSGTKCSTAL